MMRSNRDRSFKGIRAIERATAAAVDWDPLSDTLPSLSITSVAFADDNTTMYAGVGKLSNGGLEAGKLIGLLVTTNPMADAPTWKRLGAAVLSGKDIRVVVPTE